MLLQVNVPLNGSQEPGTKSLSETSGSPEGVQGRARGIDIAKQGFG